MNKKVIPIFLFYLCCALLSAALFYLLALGFTSNMFFEKNLTSGSDDTTYHIEAINVANAFRFIDLWDVVEEAKVYSGHAVGYPLFLFLIYSFAPSLYIGLLCNIVFYFWAATMAAVETA